MPNIDQSTLTQKRHTSACLSITIATGSATTRWHQHQLQPQAWMARACLANRLGLLLVPTHFTARRIAIAGLEPDCGLPTAQVPSSPTFQGQKRRMPLRQLQRSFHSPRTASIPRLRPNQISARKCIISLRSLLVLRTVLNP